MSIDHSHLQLIVLQCFAQMGSDAFAQKMFSKMVELKVKAWQPLYGKKFLPLYTFDFFSCHLLLCVAEKTDWLPIVGYSPTSLKMCQFYKQKFPYYSQWEMYSKAQEHFKAINLCIQESEALEKDLWWDSELSIHPNYKNDQEFLREAIAAMNVFYHQSMPASNRLRIGMLKNHMDQFWEKWGYEKLRWEGQLCPALKIACMNQEEVFLMCLKNFSDLGIQISKNYRELWEKRIEIDSPQKDSKNF